jgi:hypothetical protein
MFSILSSIAVCEIAGWCIFVYAVVPGCDFNRNWLIWLVFKRLTLSDYKLFEISQQLLEKLMIWHSCNVLYNNSLKYRQSELHSNVDIWFD